MMKPLIIGHRGASAITPENTITAFRRAMQDGADGIECDVRLSRDKQPVVIHDATLNRTALSEGNVSDFTASELAQIDVGTWFNQRHPSRARKNFLKETIPSLAQVFELMYGYEGLVYVEMKCENLNHCDLAKATADLIRDFKFESRVVVKSFEHESLVKMKSYAPEIRTAALFSPRPARVLKPGRELIMPTIECAADEISLHYTLARKRTITKATLAELPTVIWTADHPVWVKRAIRLGIYAIITNNPVRLLARRNQLLVRHNSRILIPKTLLE